MISKSWAVFCVLLAAASAWKTSGQIGYERGDSHANWEAHYAAAQNRATMKQIGTCRWAQLAAGCDWRDTKPH